MARTTIVFGVLLILLGLGFFLGTGAAHLTALIPAAFGAVLLLLGLLAARDAWRMHAMHLVAMVALLGVAGAVEGPIRSVMHGKNVEFDARFAARVLMALLCALLLTLCAKSFVDAWIRRKLGRRDAWCSFCRKNWREVGPLAEGPDHVYICYSCIRTCEEIIEKNSPIPGNDATRCPHCSGLLSNAWSDIADGAKCPNCGDSLHAAAPTSSKELAKAVSTTKEEIRNWVNRFSILSQEESQPNKYFQELVQGLVRVLAAKAGAFWIPDGRSWTMRYAIGLPSAEIAEDSLCREPHYSLVETAISTGTAFAIPPGGTSPNPQAGANPTNSLLLLSPIKHCGRTRVLVEIFQRPGAGPVVQRAYMRFLGQICDKAASSPVLCPAYRT